jgi:hypothetical protein
MKRAAYRAACVQHRAACVAATPLIPPMQVHVVHVTCTGVHGACSRPIPKVKVPNLGRRRRRSPSSPKPGDGATP